jgi:hypothetical protein
MDDDALDIDQLRAILDIGEGPPVGAVYAMSRNEAAGFAAFHVTTT